MQEEKPKIYCVQSGLGKTWLCHHYPGFYDIDSYIYEHPQPNVSAFAATIRYAAGTNYIPLVSLSPFLSQYPILHNFELIFVIATDEYNKKLPEIVRQRSNSQGNINWANGYSGYCELVPKLISNCNSKIFPRRVTVYKLEEGQHLEDFFKKQGMI